jgi:DNA repair protein RadC
MAKIDDCLKTMRQQGAVIDAKDETQIRELIEQGMEEMNAVRSVFISRAKNVVDITARARREGATIAPYRDAYDEVVTRRDEMLAMAAQSYMDERNQAAQELAQVELGLDDIQTTITMIEAAGNAFGVEPRQLPGIDTPATTFLLATATDEDLLRIFDVMRFQDRRRMAEGDPTMLSSLGLEGNNAEEVLESFRGLLARRLELMQENRRINNRMREMEKRWRTITDREWRNPDFGSIDSDGNYRIEPADTDGVAEEIWSYSYRIGGVPWEMSRSGEGDLYIRRHGKNAGTPHRERQSENDIAITFDKSALLPDFMFYLLTYLQPEIASRARGTAQQYITPSDVQNVLIKYFQSQAVKEVRPSAYRTRKATGDLYSDQETTTPAQRKSEAIENYKARVGLVEEGTMPTGLDTVTNESDAAHVMANIRRNAQEGFWALVTDENGKVLAVLQHAKGGIDGTSVYPSVVAGHIYQIPGAKKVWFAHNHPSGSTNPSQADERITKKMHDLMLDGDVEIQGHLIFASGRSHVALLAPWGGLMNSYVSITPAARTMEAPILTRRLKSIERGRKVTSPSEAEAAADDIGGKEGVIYLDNRHHVVGFMEMTPEQMEKLRNTGQGTRILKAASELNAAAAIMVTNDDQVDAASNVAAFMNIGDIRLLDHLYKRPSTGTWRSRAAQAEMPGQGAVPMPSTFHQDLVGITSGLLEAARAMPQEKGPAEQMISVLKKQPGVKKEEIEWVAVEDWIRNKGYVTRDEIIDFIDKNGVVVEEKLLGEHPTLVSPTINIEPVRGDIAESIAMHYDQDINDIQSGDIRVYEAVDSSNDMYYTVFTDAEAGNVTVIDDDTEEQIPIADPINNQDLFSVYGAIRNYINEQRFDVFAGEPRYTEHTLPGGSVHREMVLLLPHPAGKEASTIKVSGRIIVPDSHVAVDTVVSDLLDTIIADFHNPEYQLPVEGMDWGRVGNQVIELNNLTEQQWDTVSGIVDLYLTDGALLEETGREGDMSHLDYTESHAYGDTWSNVLLWVRLTEREGPNGERILLVEEVQSDWHQTGRQFGYRQGNSDVEQAQQELDRLLNEAHGLRQMTDSAVLAMARAYFANPESQGKSFDLATMFASGIPEDLSGAQETVLIRDMRNIIRTRSDWLLLVERVLGDTWSRNNLRSGTITDIANWRTTQLRAKQKQTEINEMISSPGLSPPDAPFKGNAWAELAMKRVIRMAAEEGYDAIAWTTGDQQNDRWNLSSHVDYLDYDPGEHRLAGYGDDRFDEIVSPDELDQWIGRELADRLRQQIVDIEARYDIVPAADAGIERSDIAEFLVDTDSDTPPPGYVIIDANGDVVRTWGGDILWYSDDVSFREDFWSLRQDIGHDLPQLVDEGLVAGGAGMRSFYDGVLSNVTSRAAKKLDKKSKVQRFGGRVRQKEPVGERLRIAEPGTGGVSLWSIVNEKLEMPFGFFSTRAKAQEALDKWREEEFATVHQLDITAKLGFQAMEGQTLFQDRQRGSISFNEQNKAIIRMTRARDMSTFLHESGHLYLELMADLAEMPGASEQTIADYNKILGFLGVEHRSQVKRIHHEKFARAFEAYLREGKSPDPALRDTFLAFKAWLMKIYKQLARLDVELNDDIRGVFDRMIATDAAIKQASRTQELVELFTTAEDMGISAEAFEVYRQNAVQAHEDALDREHRRVFNFLLQEEKEWYADERKKVEEEVRQEAYAMKVYRALSMLQRGKNPDGSEPTTAPFKLSKDSLMRVLGFSQQTLNRLPRPYIYSAKGGIDAAIAAREFGYVSAAQMITEIMRTTPMETFIRSETDARMAERFPDPLTSGELQEQALDAVHNDRRAQVMAAEMRALRKRIREDRKIVVANERADRRKRLEARQKLPKRGEIALIKEAAKLMIAKMRVRDVKPHLYLAAERKAGRKAFAALEKKDYEAAYEFKRQQLVNHEMYRAAVRAKDTAESTRKYLTTFDRKAKRQRMGKAGVLDRIDAALAGINFKKISLPEVDRQKAKAELIQAIKDGVIVASHEVMARLEDAGTNYQDLTNLELQGVRDVVRQLEKIGKNHYEMIVNGEKQNIQQTAGELAQAMRDVDEVIPIGVGQTRLRQATKNIAQGAVNSVLRPGAIARILDGANFGAFTQKIIAPIRRAYAERMQPRFQKASEDVVEIYLRHYDDKELRSMNSELHHVEALGESLTKGEMLSIALNWGTESNRKALLNGKKQNGDQAYPQQAVRAILGSLTEADWRFVQDVWDYLDTYWDEVKDAEQRRRGIAPDKVERLAFEIRTADGTTVELKGGYYPLVYDARHSRHTKIQQFEDVQKKMANGAYVSANTRAGATYNRVENHGKVVRLGLNTIDLHLREIIRDITIGDEVNFVKRVLDDPDLYAAFQETNNQEALRQLNMWLSDSAVGELPAAGIVEQALAYSRTGFTKAKIGWNLVTMFLQLTGIFQTAAEMGTVNYARGLGKVMQDPKKSWKFVMAESAFMHQRYEQGAWNKDVMDAREHLQSDQFLLNALLGEGPTKARRVTKRLARTYFAPIMYMQSVVDVTTWMAGYTVAQNDGKSHQDSVLFADARVEAAQTSGFFSDRSGLERGTINRKTVQSQFIRIWTTLISYMLAKSGIAYEKGVQLRRDVRDEGFKFGTAVHFATDMLLLFTLEGIASALIYGNLPDEDEDESLAWWTTKVSLESMVSGIPFVRETMSARYGGGNTVIGALSRDVYQVYMQAAQGEIDAALLKSLNNVGGTLLHYPSSQTNRIMESAWKEAEGGDVALYEYGIGIRENE